MKKTINKIPSWLRWLLLIPSIVCYIIASWFIMYGFLLLIGSININNWIDYTLRIIFLFILSGFIIQIAAYMAPKGKLLVSFIFAALILIFSVFVAIDLNNFILSIICASGAIVSLIIVINNIWNKKHSELISMDERTVAKKRAHQYLAACILLLIVAAGGASMYIVKNTERTGVLFVNGKEITGVSAIIRYDDAALPFTEVLKGFGFNITWRDSNIADITYEDKTYVLNSKEASLTGEGKEYDLLMPLPGSTNHYCKEEGRELFVDSDTIRSTMYDLGKKIDINIDLDKLIVYVNTRID